MLDLDWDYFKENEPKWPYTLLIMPQKWAKVVYIVI